MSENAKLDPATLSAEERALWDTLAIRKLATGTLPENAYARSEGALIDLLKVRRALFGTATEKVECPNCGQPTEESPDRPLFNDHLCQYPCQPAQPEPADSRQERADQIKSFLGGDDDEPARLEPAAPIAQEWDENVPAPIGFNKPEPAETVDTRDEQIAYARSIFDKPEPAAQGEMPDEVDRACDLLEWSGNVNAAAALRDAWRTHSQPNCSRCGKPFVDGAYHHPKNVDVCGTCYAEMRPKVELPKVREFIDFILAYREKYQLQVPFSSLEMTMFKLADTALSELDAAEGRK